jgi:hypothetical protein
MSRFEPGHMTLNFHPAEVYSNSVIWNELGHLIASVVGGARTSSSVPQE